MTLELKDFLYGNSYKVLIKFATPILLALFLQAFYSAVDLWMVGQFASTNDVSSVAIGSQTILIFLGLISGLSTGISVLLAKNIGEKNVLGAKKIIVTGTIIFLIFGFFLSLIIFFLAKPIALYMHTPKEALDGTISYIQICGGGLIFIVLYNLISSILKGCGNSRSPLLFVFIASIINIITDYILIKYYGMGAKGAAIATIFSQAMSVIFSLIYIKIKKIGFNFNKNDMRFDVNSFKEIMKIGAPIGVQDFFNEVSYLLLFGFVNVLGLAASSGVGIAEKLIIFVLLIPNTFLQAISTITAQNVGAKNYLRTKKILKSGLILSSSLGLIMAIILFFFGENLSIIFMDSTVESAKEAIKDSGIFLKATSLECFIFSISYCLSGFLSGYRKTTFIMVQTLLTIFLIKEPYCYLATYVMTPSLFNIGLGLVFAALFSLILLFVFYLILDKKNKKENLY